MPDAPKSKPAEASLMPSKNLGEEFSLDLGFLLKEKYGWVPQITSNVLLAHIAYAGNGKYCSTVFGTFPGFGRFALTLDLDTAMLEQVVKRSSPENRAVIRAAALESRPVGSVLMLPSPMTISVTARPGESTSSKFETYTPFIVTRVL